MPIDATAAVGRRPRALRPTRSSKAAAPAARVRYRMTSAPLFVHCCHCRWCQRETGTAFALNAMIEADRVSLLQGEPEVVDTPSNSGQGQKIARCPKCRVAVWSNYAGAGDAVRFVRVGTLDEPDRVPPDIHIFTSSKQPWVVLAAQHPGGGRVLRPEGLLASREPGAAPRADRRARAGGLMHTLYGSQGSGSAAVEAALAMCGLPYRIVSAASWDPASALAELARANPLAADPDARAAGRDGVDRKRGDPDPPRPRIPGVGPAAGGRRAARPGDPRPRLHRRQLLRGDRRDRLSGTLVRRRHRGNEGAHPRGARVLACTVIGRSSPTCSPHRARSSAATAPGALDLLAAVVSKWSGARAHLREARPQFSALLERIDAHPRVEPVFARHWPDAQK